jgi:hypothetical protein
VIPELVDIGGLWKVLPPGVHNATFDEVEKQFSTNKKRQMLYRGLIRGSKALKAAGCTVIYLDGSFVSEKEFPQDYDVCWNPYSVDPGKLDPVLLDFADNRSKQKSKYGGEFFPSSASADGRVPFIKYFQTSKDTGTEKGIIQIYL